jgi:hypothetical protein
MYSLNNKDLLTDSGAASVELKINVVSYFWNLFFLTLWVVLQKPVFLYLLSMLFLVNIFISRQLLRAFYETKGVLFAGLAFAYYTMLYPLPIGIGTITGLIRHLFGNRKY